MRNSTYNRGDQPQQLSIWSVMLLVVITLAIAAALYFLFESQQRFPANSETSAIRQQSTSNPQPRPGDSARSMIAELKAQNIKSHDLDRVYKRAENFIAEGQLDDAHLLLFFAARKAHPMSARVLGGMYDPNHLNASTSLTKEPNLTQAYKWYKIAADAGDQIAAQRIEKLKDLIEHAATRGDEEAKVLLLMWRREK
ncbi:MAG: hypothetical protein GY807_08645 [Gammaproteobacteria bacterium]|nr:hypothetical protein [Gammaproteobacteria bacterium]